MFCENCGHLISDTAKFYSTCGHPVGAAPAPRFSSSTTAHPG